jgi:hypothetical protein
MKKVSGTGKSKAKFEKYSMKRDAPRDEYAETMETNESTIANKKRKY